jgi:hypothetical protein
MTEEQIWPVLDNIAINNIPGNIAMFGVGINDSVFVGQWCKEYNRLLYLFDSFMGLPEPRDNGDRRPECDIEEVEYKKYDCLTDINDAIKTVIRHDIIDSVLFVPGWFEETLLIQETYALAGVLIDVDYHTSLKTCLEYVQGRMCDNAMIASDEGHHHPVRQVFDTMNIPYIIGPRWTIYAKKTC